MDTGHLKNVCGSFRGRLQRLLLQAGVARTVLVALVLLAPLLAFDWKAHLTWSPRLVELLVYLAAVGGTVWFTLVLPLRRRWTDNEVLSYIDSTLPGGQAMLLDLYELTETPEQIQEVQTATGKQLAGQAVAALKALAEQVNLAGTIEKRKANSWLGGGAAAVAALALIAIFPAPREHLVIGLERLFNPFSSTRWPHRTDIAVDHPEMVPQFDPLTIEAEATGEVPDKMVLFYREQGKGDFEKGSMSIERTVDPKTGKAVGKAKYTLERITSPLEFYVEGGDFETDRYKVGVADKPYIKTVTAHFRPPRYSGLPVRDEASRQLTGLEGTEVDVKFESSMRLTKAVLVPITASGATQPDAAEGPEDLKMTSPTTFEKTFMLRDDRAYSIELREEHGVRQASEERVNVKVIRDNPPTVDLLSPGGDMIQTNKALVEVSFVTTDDFGLAKVEFLYQLDNGKEVLLTDRITGPVKQDGLKSESRFSWALRKSEIPESGLLTCWVRAKDVNPLPGRGLVESRRAQIKLVKPTEFHLEVLEQTSKLLAEARLAWMNQHRAYASAQKWLQAAGKDADPVWRDLTDAQDKAFAATRAMKQHIEWLTEQYERNQMAGDFMAGRLTPISSMIALLLDKEHPPIAAGLKSTVPRSDTDAAPAVQLQLRMAALKKFEPNQKMAVLLAERILTRLYNWRNLQIATVTTKSLMEQQDEVHGLTKALPLEWVGKQVEDLIEKDQDRLATVGKQQKAIFDTETGLEQQLDDVIYAAEQRDQLSIVKPIQIAFRVLRDNRINDSLKVYHAQIADNQFMQVLDGQKRVASVLRDVYNGLVAAGQKSDDDEGEIKLASAVKPLGWDPEDPKNRERPKSTQPEPPTGTGGDITPPPPPPPPPPETLMAGAIFNAKELQDAVRARLSYLSKNGTAAEMPRFMDLKWLMLVNRQEEAGVGGINEAIKIAGSKASTRPDGTAGLAGSPAVREALAAQREEFTQFEKLLAAKDMSETHHQAQLDSIATLGDMLQMTGWENAVEEEAGEIRRQKGVDAFNRRYAFNGPELDAMETMLADLNYALLLQRDVIRKAQRLGKVPAQGPLMAEFEKDNRGRAAKAQKKVADLAAAVTAKAVALTSLAKPPVTGTQPSDEDLRKATVVEKIQQSGANVLSNLKLGDYAAPLGAGTLKDQQLGELKNAEQVLASTMQGLKEALGERVKPLPPPPATGPDGVDGGPPVIAATRESLADGIKKNTSLPPQVRDRLLRALEKPFPPKYQDLLTQYYLSFVSTEKEKAKE